MDFFIIERIVNCMMANFKSRISTFLTQKNAKSVNKHKKVVLYLLRLKKSFMNL
jgi:hypothetical protein